jgi:ADP-heptose:LPS heptosyltransferase
MNILLYNSGGGLGDCIQLIDLLTTLKYKFSNSTIWYLGAHQNHFDGKLKDYNIKINTLDLDLKYFGFRWKHLFFAKKKCQKIMSKNFDLTIDLQSKIRNTLILKKIPTNFLYSPTMNFAFCTKKLNFINTKNNPNDLLKNLEKILDTNIDFIKYDINNINKIYFDEALKLLPNNNYIGLSVTQGNEYRKKTWPIEKFINIAIQLSKQNKQPVFFIEKNNQELISKIKNQVENALFPETNSALSGPALVTALSTRLSIGISIDNGVMHMMGLANIPMIVLFGPTNSDKFAPRIDKINILDSKLIYNSDDISKITEQDVLNLI